MSDTNPPGHQRLSDLIARALHAAGVDEAPVVYGDTYDLRLVFRQTSSGVCIVEHAVLERSPRVFTYRDQG